ncbi:MAG TPA: hypothetical protein DD640_07740, partial [Clostridiales bacterium]|nr:hypothetical protein [Clostridiales bacterium]
EPKATVAETTAPATGENDFALGLTNGGTYSNTFVGIGCDLDDNWTYYSDEQIREMNGIATDMIDDEELLEMLEESEIVYDMLAVSSNGFDNININLENLGLVYGSVLSESGYVDVAIGPLEKVYADIDASVLSLEKGTIQFAGAEHYAINVHVTVNDNDLYQKIICLKAGNYMCNITISTSFADRTDEIAALFYSLD